MHVITFHPVLKTADHCTTSPYNFHFLFVDASFLYTASEVLMDTKDISQNEYNNKKVYLIISKKEWEIVIGIYRCKYACLSIIRQYHVEKRKIAFMYMLDRIQGSHMTDNETLKPVL